MSIKNDQHLIDSDSILMVANTIFFLKGRNFRGGGQNPRTLPTGV